MISLRRSVVVLVACGVACTDGKSAVRDTAQKVKPPATAEGPVAVPQPASGSAVAPAGDRRIVLFLGTSLTAGLGLDPDSAYPQRLQRKIDARSLPYQVVNAGVSGETSAGLLRRLDWVLQRPADVIVIETGANDGLRGLPVTATKATIAEILSRIRRERPNARVALVQMEAPPNLGREYTSAFHQMFADVAKEQGVVLLPFLLEHVAGYPDLNQGDGIHPNDEGERIVTENVWRALQPLLIPRPSADSPTGTQLPAAPATPG
jgi:acyl-CoA thioesterase-1